MAVAALEAQERRYVRCGECGSIIALEIAGLHVIKVQRREWTAYLVSARCACGALWRIDRPPLPDVLDSQ